MKLTKKDVNAFSKKWNRSLINGAYLANSIVSRTEWGIISCHPGNLTEPHVEEEENPISISDLVYYPLEVWGPSFCTNVNLAFP